MTSAATITERFAASGMFPSGPQGRARPAAPGLRYTRGGRTLLGGPAGAASPSCPRNANCVAPTTPFEVVGPHIRQAAAASRVFPGALMNAAMDGDLVYARHSRISSFRRTGECCACRSLPRHATGSRCAAARRVRVAGPELHPPDRRAAAPLERVPVRRGLARTRAVRPRAQPRQAVARDDDPCGGSHRQERGHAGHPIILAKATPLKGVALHLARRCGGGTLALG